MGKDNPAQCVECSTFILTPLPNLMALQCARTCATVQGASLARRPQCEVRVTLFAACLITFSQLAFWSETSVQTRWAIATSSLPFWCSAGFHPMQHTFSTISFFTLPYQKILCLLYLCLQSPASLMPHCGPNLSVFKKFPVSVSSLSLTVSLLAFTLTFSLSQSLFFQMSPPVSLGLTYHS